MFQQLFHCVVNCTFLTEMDGKISCLLKKAEEGWGVGMKKGIPQWHAFPCTHSAQTEWVSEGHTSAQPNLSAYQGSHCQQAWVSFGPLFLLRSLFRHNIPNITHRKKEFLISNTIKY